jgi:uncharacterized protein
MNFNTKIILALFLNLSLSNVCFSQKKVSDTSKIKKAKTSSDVFQFKVPPHSGKWVSDFEDIFSKEDEKILDSLINQFEKETTIEISVVTLDTSWTIKETFDDFVLAIHNYWGVGKKQTNNGIVIGICPGYRTIRISNGYGIEEKLTDAETKKIIDNIFYAVVGVVLPLLCSSITNNRYKTTSLNFKACLPSSQSIHNSSLPLIWNGSHCCNPINTRTLLPATWISS